MRRARILLLGAWTAVGCSGTQTLPLTAADLTSLRVHLDGRPITVVPRPPPPGQPRRPGPLIGIGRVDAEAVSVGLGNNQWWRVPLDEVAEIRRRSPARGFAIGVGIGAATGGLVGAVAGGCNGDHQIIDLCLGRAVTGILLGILGSVVGGAVGAGVAPERVWSFQ